MDLNVYLEVLSSPIKQYELNESKVPMGMDYDDLNCLMSQVKRLVYISQAMKVPVSEREAVVNNMATSKGVFTAIQVSLGQRDMIGIRALHPIMDLFNRLVKELLFNNMIMEEYFVTQPQINAVSTLLYRFSDETDRAEYQKKRANFLRAATKNQSSAMHYVNQLFEQYAKLLVVRVDFSYKNEHKRQMTGTIAQQHRERFFRNAKANKLFDHMVGYIWKLEYGERRGFHYHMLFFFDGANVRQDITLARLIGEYWSLNITAGAGIYYNCNLFKADYDKLGIGMIAYSDLQMREVLQVVIEYLTKIDEFVRLALPENARAFGRGEIVSPEGNKLGRPRLHNKQA
ncbi:inovirus-type Gp2 protein [Yersinia intermedia]|nr:inovirus-type Gp2 protein [Yersinia intermedia]